MRRAFEVLFASCWLLAALGCTRISVAPSCPEELKLGESASLRANEENPGAIPTYKWEVSPSEAGEFDPLDAPVTTFLAKETGEATVRLTAADGLYQVIAECRITVLEVGDVAVSVSVSPDPPVAGEEATIACRSIGETVAETRTMEQTGGALVELDFVSEGVATFTPAQPGELSFTCVGRSAGGRESEPDTLTVLVLSEPDDDGADNDNDNDNGGGRPPIRP